MLTPDCALKVVCSALNVVCLVVESSFAVEARLQKTGHAPLGGNTVGDAMRYGARLREPKIGAMAVISTSYGRQGHVGFVKGVNADGSIELISGNWGRKVGDAHIPRRQVVAFVDVE